MKNKTTSKTKGRIIWAVDPFPKDKKTQFRTFTALARLTQNSEDIIEPVAVLGPDQLYVPQQVFAGSQKAYTLEAQRLLEEWSKELKHPRLASPVLLLQDQRGAHVAEDTLLTYARKSQASLIAVGAHTKKVIERFLLGSFAEGLILKSDVPVLVVNPKSKKVDEKIKRILFATDFSRTSKNAYEQVLDVAAKLKATVVVYNKSQYVVPGAPFGMPYIQDNSAYYEAEKRTALKEGKAWVARASSRGVRAKFIFEEEPYGIPDGILRISKKEKVGLVAMASESSVARAALLGSVARHVVRRSTVPIWVIHRRDIAGGAEEADQSPSLAQVPRIADGF